jgi:hypothetical protein
MKTEFKSSIRAAYHSFGVVCAVAVTLLLGVLASSVQASQYLFTGSETTVTLNPGLYNITAYGAQGGGCYQNLGGLGAEMEGEFDFTTVTTLTLLVGGVGGTGSGQFGSGGGGGGGSFVANGTSPVVVAGGGGGGGAASSNAGNTGTSGGSGGGGGSVAGGSGGTNGGDGQGGSGGGGGGFNSFLSGGAGRGNGGFGGGGGGVSAQAGGGGGGYSGGGGGGIGQYNFDYGFGGGGGGSIIDSSVIAIITEVSGVASPNGSPNGEIIITAVPEPNTLVLAGLGGLAALVVGRHRKLSTF